MKRYTGQQELVASNVELWNPMTGPLDTTGIRSCAFAVWLAGLAALKARPGGQFSPDGTNWDTPFAIDLDTSPNQYATAANWTFGNGAFTNLFTISGVVPKLYIRFGLWAVDTTGSASEGAIAELMILSKPFWSRTFATPPRRVFSNGTTTYLTQPLSDPFPVENVSEVRATLDFESSTGNYEGKLAIQFSNRPTIQNDWGGDVDLTSATSTVGILPGTTFSTITPNKTHARIVWKGRNTTGVDFEAARVSSRIDLRSS